MPKKKPLDSWTGINYKRTIPSTSGKKTNDQLTITPTVHQQPNYPYSPTEGERLFEFKKKKSVRKRRSSKKKKSVRKRRSSKKKK